MIRVKEERNMDLEEVANKMNGKEYGEETNDIDLDELKKLDVVVLFGYSDDNAEFRGAIDDEVGCYEGDTLYLTPNGLVTNECDDEDCPYYLREKEKAFTIEAIWDSEGYSWIYKTSIPHKTFDIMEDGKKYCRGIVFRLSELRSD